MKKLILALLLLAPFAGAQETWPSQSATAEQVTAAETARLIYNAETCRERSLPVGCTQAHVDAVRGVYASAETCVAHALPVDCTQAQLDAVIPDNYKPATLAPNTAAGRAAVARGFITRYTPAPSAPFVVRIKQEVKWNSWTQAKRDDYCVSVLELEAGCDPFAG